MVYFIGGVTWMEIAALRFLNSRSDFPFTIVVATTKLVNGNTFLRAILPEVDNRLGKSPHVIAAVFEAIEGMIVALGPIKILQSRVSARERVRAVDVDSVVQFPVHVADSTSGMVEALEDVLENLDRSERDEHTLDRFEDRGDHVR